MTVDHELPKDGTKTADAARAFRDGLHAKRKSELKR
jgi:hypothetical protein